MSTPTRKRPNTLFTLDPEVVQLARDAAKREGVPLSRWVELAIQLRLTRPTPPPAPQSHALGNR